MHILDGKKYTLKVEYDEFTTKSLEKLSSMLKLYENDLREELKGNNSLSNDDKHRIYKNDKIRNELVQQMMKLVDRAIPKLTLIRKEDKDG